jgi:hypothetical protein
MTNLPLRRLRGWLARKGFSPQRGIYSRSLWGVCKADIGKEAVVGQKADVGRRADIGQIESSEHGQSPGCDAWPIHVVLRELDKGRGFGFAHFNDGECRCLIEGSHTNRDGVEICPEHVRVLLANSLARLTTTSDPRIRQRFLVGLPCPRCHGVRAEDVLREFPGLKRHHRVPATLFHHAIRWGRPRLAAALAERAGDAFLVCSTEHDVDAVERLLGISFRAVLRVDRLRAHESPHVFDAWADEIGWGHGATDAAASPRTLLLLCGIMGRCWAVQAFVSDPDSLTLCLGSYFDDVALGRVLKYAGSETLRCERCLRPG